MLNNENPIKSGDTVDGIVNGQFNVNLQWPCRYEGALIQPAREVIDVFMNEYAAGARKFLLFPRETPKKHWNGLPKGLTNEGKRL